MTAKSVLMTVRAAGPVFVAGASTGKIYTSDDGVTWTSRGTLAGAPSIQKMVSNAAGTVVAVYSTGSAYGIARSTDGGITWTYPTSPASSWTQFWGLTWGSDVDTFWLVGGVTFSPSYTWSTDGGATWATSITELSGGMNATPMSFVRQPVTGHWLQGDSTTNMWRSTSLSSPAWTSSTLSSASNVIHLAYAPGLGGANGRVLAMDDTSGLVRSYTSDNATSWTSPVTISNRGSGVKVLWANARSEFIFLEDDLTMWHSPDGVNWGSVGLTPCPVGSTNDMAWSETLGMLCAVASFGGVCTSPNGATTWPNSGTFPGSTSSDNFLAVAATR